MDYTNVLMNYNFESNNLGIPTHVNSNDVILKCVCGLDFDDEIGQTVEAIWPENALDSSALKALCGLGFPETSVQNGEGEIKFLFRIRKCNEI
jgi:hypothetical protein